MKPFSVELSGTFHAYRLCGADGREITDLLAAAEFAESEYGCDWQNVHNDTESLDRDDYLGPIDVAFAIHRHDTQREVVAIIPALATTTGHLDHAVSYTHSRQNGDCIIDGVAASHVNASSNEYADLLMELRSIGYNVYVISLERIQDSKYVDARSKELDCRK